MGKQVTELDTLPSFTDTSLLPVHNGAGLKKGLLSQLADYIGTKFSNPNLLINPDLLINQRGKNTYDSQYSVDRWKIYNALYNVSTKNLSNPNSSDGNFVQTFENPLNGTYTITVHCSSVTGKANFTWGGESVIVKEEVGDLKEGNNIVTIKATDLRFIGVLVKPGASVIIDYIKLEQGSIATPFVAPNPAEELEKCLRFSRYIPIIYCVPSRRYVGDISNAGAYYLPLGCVFETKLRVKGTITLKGGIFDNAGSNLGSVREIDYSTDEIRTVIMSQEMTPWTIVVKQVFIDAEIY